MHVFDGAFDILFRQGPIVIEIGNHLFHEWFGQPDCMSFVAKMIVQDGQCQLLRARSLVCPLKTPLCELLDTVVLTERTAIDRHAKPVDLSYSLIRLHRTGPTA